MRSAMHLRTLRSEGERFVHAVWQVYGPAGSWAAGALAPLRAALDALTLIHGVTLSKRVVAVPGQGMRATWQALVSQHQDAALRESLAMLLLATRQTTLVYASPADDAGFDAALADAPAMRSVLTPGRYAAQGCWLALPCSATALWPRLAWHAEASGEAIGYQVNLYPHRPQTGQQREALVNLERLRRVPGVPPQWVVLLVDRIRRMHGSHWLAEEVLMASTPTAADAVRRQVGSVFTRANTWVDAGPALAFEPGGCRDVLELACGCDEAWAGEADYVASQAHDPAAARMALDPEDDASALPTPANAPPAAVGTLEPPPVPGPPYVFISYAHADRAAMHAARAALQSAGLTVWVDERLQAGEEWAAVLEERIRRCALMLVLMSPTAAASAFVRRELRFADAMQRRLLWLRLQPTELRDGLAMLLLPLQWIDAEQPDAHRQLADAARRWITEEDQHPPAARRTAS